MASGEVRKEGSWTKKNFARQFSEVFRKKTKSRRSMSSGETPQKDTNNPGKETPNHPKSPRKHSSLLSVFSRDKKVGDRDFGKVPTKHTTDDTVTNLSSSTSLLTKPLFRRSQSESGELNVRAVAQSDTPTSSSSKLVTIKEDLKPAISVIEEEEKNADKVFTEVYKEIDKEMTVIPPLPLRADILINRDPPTSAPAYTSPRRYGALTSQTNQPPPSPPMEMREIPTQQSIQDQLTTEMAMQAFNTLSVSLVNVQETMKQMNNQMLLMQQNQVLLQKRLLHQDQTTAETNKQLGHIMSLSDHVLGVQDSTLRWTSRLQTPNNYPPQPSPPNVYTNHTFGQTDYPFGNSSLNNSPQLPNPNNTSSSSSPAANPKSLLLENTPGLRRVPNNQAPSPGGGCAPAQNCTVQ